MCIPCLQYTACSRRTGSTNDVEIGIVCDVRKRHAHCGKRRSYLALVNLSVHHALLHSRLDAKSQLFSHLFQGSRWFPPPASLYVETVNVRFRLVDLGRWKITRKSLLKGTIRVRSSVKQRDSPHRKHSIVMMLIGARFFKHRRKVLGHHHYVGEVCASMLPAQHYRSVLRTDRLIIIALDI